MAPAPGTSLRVAILASIALTAMAVVAAIGAPVFLLIGLVLGALAVIWAAAIEQRRASASRERDLQVARADTAAIAGDLSRERAAAAEVRALLDALDEPVLATSASGAVSLCNAAAAELLGLQAERAIGRPIDEVFTQAEILRLYQQARGGRGARGEVRIPRPGGVRVWEVSVSPVAMGPDPAGGGVAIGLRDITELARAMQVRSDFAANASHELRTPIAAMRIAMDTLQGLGPEEVASRERFMGMIARNIERLEAMVRDLLDLSRLESPEVEVRREAIAVASLIADLEPLYESILRERSLKLRFDFPPTLAHLRSDRNLLMLILGNLIDNATKYAFEGTEITVQGVPMDNLGGVRLEVTDRGIGIPLDQQQRIFERYYQVDAARSIGSPRRGTGLGLSIVKHAVRRLGGSIRVESVWQQGTRMIVELPGEPLTPTS
jgi:two-component system phosphate regulon sensor histidine kinase PhoR